MVLTQNLIEDFQKKWSSDSRALKEFEISKIVEFSKNYENVQKLRQILQKQQNPVKIHLKSLGNR